MIPSRAGFRRQRIAMNLARATPVTVTWNLVLGNVTVNPVDQSSSGDTDILLSGTIRGHGKIEPAANVVRTFKEVETGDLILDVAPEPVVTLFDGQAQSGVVSLRSIKDKDPRFFWFGRAFAQKTIGAELSQVWENDGEEKLYTTLLLRPAP